MIKIEVCANSVQDCLVAQNEGADRIELISASYLGGLTPTLTVLDMALENGVEIPIMAMVRPRGGGFGYSEIEKEQMFREARELLGANVNKGVELLKQLQEKVGDKIEILAGAGITTENIEYIIKETRVTQVHGTFKKYGIDPTTTGVDVTYRYTDKGDYEEVNPEELALAIDIVKKLNKEMY